VAALETDRATTMMLLKVLSARLAAVEGHAEPIAPDAVTTLKGAAYATGFSQTTIRKRIAEGRIAARKIGGAVIVDASTLPARRDSFR
jgi:hypothetical protein